MESSILMPQPNGRESSSTSQIPLRHPHWVFHFTPTSASSINAVEGFFSALT